LDGTPLGYYAHSLPGRPDSEWQPLAEHLRNVSKLAGDFAAAFGAREWGELAGLWHDLGKYSTEFQAYLRAGAETCSETLPGRVDHSTAGAQYAIQAVPLLGHLAAYCIAGHHSGLLDGRAAVGANQVNRLAKEVPSWIHGLVELSPPPDPALPDFLRTALGRKDAFCVSFFTRMVFSCVVDGDYLDTERFMNAAKAGSRPEHPSIGNLAPGFFQALDALESGACDSAVNTKRKAVRAACEVAAHQVPGFFSLSVPTGGGKTLASLAFALRHALAHGMLRIVYVAPFTSIIEQNAAVFREYLGADAVLEHHCNVDPDRESEANRLAAENWDAPVIVTTAVQFYESLFANRPTRCRKLHRLARSIVILDEAQTLPVQLLSPCLRALEQLAGNYGTTVVLCTATQPEIRWREDFDIGLRDVREIVSEPAALYERLRRVRVADLGMVKDEDLAARLLAERCALCIVNTTHHARALFEAIGPRDGHFHLSARMCPVHRKDVLDQIRARLETDDAVCRVISTQVVEAGVDLDFPVVCRAIAGLDSIAQAAGRCNRNGRLPSLGQVFVFQTEHASANRFMAETAGCAAQVMSVHEDDPLALAAMERYFRLYYWDQKARWDERGILDQFRLDGKSGSTLPFDFDFASAAGKFHLIDDAAPYTVIVPWEEHGRELCGRLRAKTTPSRELLRKAQRYGVQVRLPEWSQAVGRQDVRLLFDNLGVLESAEAYYNRHIGLDFKAEGPGAYFG
jgi:CRISPR-associated endonuclease/helicase Cas3